MAWIEMVEPAAAKGLLKRVYDGAVRRAGKVYNIIRIQSLRPKVARSSTQLYLEVMHGEDNALSRAQREMIATVTSATLHCRF